MSGAFSVDAFLRAKERVLWEGHPDRAFFLPMHKVGFVVLGLLIGGLLCAITLACAQPTVGPSVALTLPFALGFLALGLQTLWSDTAMRQSTRYVLTTQRAITLRKRAFGNPLMKSCPITPELDIALDEGRPMSVFFDEIEVLVLAVSSNNPLQRHKIPDGFRMIDDALEVYQLMRNLQKPR